MHNIEELPPFPEGWYFITSRSSLQKKKLIRKTWLGKEIVAWCEHGQGSDQCNLLINMNNKPDMGLFYGLEHAFDGKKYHVKLIDVPSGAGCKHVFPEFEKLCLKNAMLKLPPFAQ